MADLERGLATQLWSAAIETELGYVNRSFIVLGDSAAMEPPALDTSGHALCICISVYIHAMISQGAVAFLHQESGVCESRNMMHDEKISLAAESQEQQQQRQGC